MMINIKTGYIFERPDDLYPVLSRTVENLEFENVGNDYVFHIPNNIKDDHLKSVYKVGFLRKFYKILFPDIPYSKIHKAINSQWQVFKSERQMERLSKKYIEKFEKKEEN